MIDAVVATRDSRELVLECVDRLRSPLLDRVTVVDNGSLDGTADAVREARPEVDVVRLDRPEGLSYAYNRGAELGRAESVLFLNDDVFANDTGIAALRDALDERPDAVAVAGRLVDPGDGRTQIEYLPQPFPTLRTFAGTLVGLARRAEPLSESETVAVDQPPGACLLVRRKDFEAVAGWDEDFEFWYEDVDLARRLRPRGPVLYVPAAAFPHVGGHSARRLSRAELIARHYRGALLYARKHFGLPQRVAAGLLYALVAAARVPLARDAESRRAYGRVLRNGLRVAAGRRPLAP